MNDIQPFEGMPVIHDRRASGDRLVEGITVIFSDITRYPTEIIESHADLETDLGIDSVKFGEIFAALRERYSLPPPEVMKTFPPERFRTVAAIADLIAELGATEQRAAAEKPAGSVIHIVPVESTVPTGPIVVAVPLESVTTTSLVAEVTQIVADMTRYPPELLEADADFENDLGIDSVKLGEIFAVLRDKYHLPSAEELRERWKPEIDPLDSRHRRRDRFAPGRSRATPCCRAKGFGACRCADNRLDQKVRRKNCSDNRIGPRPRPRPRAAFG